MTSYLDIISTNKPNFELTFWGDSEGIKYKRNHLTVDLARAEARRVHAKMRQPARHAGIVYDLRTGVQVCSVMR
jgi:hypothetical protein